MIRWAPIHPGVIFVEERQEEPMLEFVTGALVKLLTKRFDLPVPMRSPVGVGLHHRARLKQSLTAAEAWLYWPAFSRAAGGGAAAEADSGFWRRRLMSAGARAARAETSSLS